MKLPCEHAATHHLTSTWWEGQATLVPLPLLLAELSLPERIPGEAFSYATCFACIICSISTTGSNCVIQRWIFQQWPPGSLLSSTFEWCCWHADTDGNKLFSLQDTTPTFLGYLWQGHLGVWLPTVSLQWLPKLRKPRCKVQKQNSRKLTHRYDSPSTNLVPSHLLYEVWLHEQ